MKQKFNYLAIGIFLMIGGCLSAQSTTWDGTAWSNDVPNTTTDAVIAGDVAPGTFVCQKLTINSGFALVSRSLIIQDYLKI